MLGALPRERYLAAFEPIGDGRLLIAGGMMAPGEPSPEATYERKGPYRDAAVYDVAAHRVTRTFVLGEPRARPVVTMVSPRQVAIMGGYTKLDLDGDVADATHAKSYDVIDIHTGRRRTAPLPRAGNATHMPFDAAAMPARGALVLHAGVDHEEGDPIGLWHFDGKAFSEVNPPEPMVRARLHRHPLGVMVTGQAFEDGVVARLWNHSGWHEIAQPKQRAESIARLFSLRVDL